MARFEASRIRLASLAYRLLGSAADAEDTVQDAFLRWQAADRQYIEVPEAWLTKIVTHLALDRLRSATTRRERAVGAWMPEPLLAGDPMLGPADTVEQRESVTLAVLTLMERLSPVERAVYVLREAFAYSHTEIAEILGITESGSQQHAHRARRRIAVAGNSSQIDRASARRVVEAFVAAASSGRTERLVALLTDDATGISDAAGLGLAEKLIRYSTPQRLAGAVRAGFTPSPVKRAPGAGARAAPLRADTRGAEPGAAAERGATWPFVPAGRYRTARARASHETVGATLRQLLESYSAAPAFVLNPAFDMLAVNGMAEAFSSPFPRIDNLARMTFLEPVARRFCVDWTWTCQAMVAGLRQAGALYPDDSRIRHVIGELTEASGEFAELWRSYFRRARGRGPAADGLSVRAGQPQCGRAGPIGRR
ncbi:RNA polymerase sigma factor (sigma-70 family) [Nocardia sp. GAS34]|uniref:sigma-70 family RNA polymerase sigma factor n=1 Tax=unclassified Nocardia TaxID=2637762 RepID=UPI003D1C7211